MLRQIPLTQRKSAVSSFHAQYPGIHEMSAPSGRWSGGISSMATGGAFGTSDNIQVDASGTGHSDVDISNSSFSDGGQTAINISAAGTAFAVPEVEAAAWAARAAVSSWVMAVGGTGRVVDCTGSITTRRSKPLPLTTVLG